MALPAVVIKTDLSCSHCMKHMKEDISSLKKKALIHADVEYDEYNDTVKVMVFDLEKALKKLRKEGKPCKKCGTFRDITVVDDLYKEVVDEEIEFDPPPTPEC